MRNSRALHDREEMDRPLLETKQRQGPREGFLKYILVSDFLDSVVIRGVSTVLALFLFEKLRFTEDASEELVHVFIYAMFTSCIIGSLVSDGYLGQYKSIMLFCILQFCGNILLSVSSISDTLGQISSSLPHTGVMVGLLLVSLGNGAQRPCVYTFGCDQASLLVEEKIRGNGEMSLDSFEFISDSIAYEKKMATQQFLAADFWTIKLGYVVGNLIAPAIRVQSKGAYFPLFLSLACAKALSTLAFWFGSNHYSFENSNGHVSETGNSEDDRDQLQGKYLEGAVRIEVSSLVGFRVQQSAKSTKRSWEDWKGLGHALIVMMPVSIFMALDAQSQSTWVFQARQMNGKLNLPWLGEWTIQPDQMPVLGQLFTVLSIPLLETVIYPFVEKFIVNLTSLRKVVCSMLLVTMAFFMSGVLQIAINNQLHIKGTATDQAEISILWQIPQITVLAFAESMHVIPLCEFAYREAPESMKSAVNGIMHLVLGSGNVITIAVLATLGSTVSKVKESFVFASIGTFGTLSMALLSYLYVSKQTRESRSLKHTR